MPLGNLDLAQQVIIGEAAIEDTGDLFVGRLTLQFDRFESQLA